MRNVTNLILQNIPLIKSMSATVVMGVLGICQSILPPQFNLPYNLKLLDSSFKQTCIL
jgi:hypothetical protein